jgi:hypothetical protein
MTERERERERERENHIVSVEYLKTGSEVGKVATVIFVSLSLDFLTLFFMYLRWQDKFLLFAIKRILKMYTLASKEVILVKKDFFNGMNWFFYTFIVF